MSVLQSTMGSKKMKLSKTPSSCTESPKKKIPTSSKTLFEKKKENTTMPIRKTMTSNFNVSPNNCSTKNQNLQNSINQSKKVSQPSSLMNSKSTPKNSLRLVDSSNTNKRTNGGGPKLQSTNMRRENTQSIVPKESAGSLGKTSGKGKTAPKLTESRLSTTSSLHPVAFIRDESKSFKDKLAKKATKSRPASNISNASTIIIDEVRPNIEQESKTCHPSDEITSFNGSELADHFYSSSSINSTIEDKISENDVIKTSTNCIAGCDLNEDSLKKIMCNGHDNVNQFEFTNGLLSMDHGDNFNDTIKLCVGFPEKEEFISEPLTPVLKNHIVKTECIISNNPSYENEFENETLGLGSINVGILDDRNMRTLFIPTLSCEITGENKHLNANINKNFKELMKSQSEDTSLIKSHAFNNIDPKTSWTTIDLEQPEVSMREMKQSFSGTTMNSSFDGKTFILEEPPIVSNLRENFREINREKSEKSEVETELSPLREESSVSASVKSVLQVNESVKLEDSAYPSLKSDKPYVLTPHEKYICEEADNDTFFDYIIKNADNQLGNTFSESDTCLSERTFDAVNTLEVLDQSDMYNSGNNISDSPGLVIHQLSTSDQFPETKTLSYNEKDEFDLESEDMVHTVDVSNYVWLDCKVQLNKPKPEESEIWVFGEEDSAQANYEVGDDLVELETDEQDWIVTERNFQELRACLDECKEEAEEAAKEINLLTMKNQDISKSRLSSPKNYSNKYPKKGNKIKEISINDIKVINVSESLSNQEVNLRNNAGDNSGLKDDDIDYFSVSSGDELNDNEVNNISEDNPKRSYLSFGKSCVKMKKKKEKRIFLSFLNLFKK